MQQLSVTEAAIILNLTRSRVHKLISEARIKAQKIGNFWTINEDDLQKFMLRPRTPGRPVVNTDEKKLLKKIMTAVKKEALSYPSWMLEENRREISNLAAVALNEKGINVASTPYLQDLFIEAIDNIFA